MRSSRLRQARWCLLGILALSVPLFAAWRDRYARVAVPTATVQPDTVTLTAEAVGVGSASEAHVNQSSGMHDLPTYGLMSSRQRLAGRLVVAAVCMLAITGFSLNRITPTSCRGPDSFSNYQITHLQELMRSANPLDSAFLRRAHLPLVASTAVQLVTADSLCSRAVAAWTAMDTTTVPPLTSLYVIKVGSTYDVIDPQHSGAEWSQHLVLDSLFHPLGPYVF